MKRFFFAFLFITSLVVYSTTLFAQEDSSGHVYDSINKAIVNQYQQQIEEFEQVRISDSIKRAGLQEQLSSLTSTDTRRKNELQAKIDSLSNLADLRYKQKKEKIDSMRSSAKVYPVTVFFNDTVLLIYSPKPSLPDSGRAKDISKKIESLTGIKNFKEDSIAIIPYENRLHIVSGTETLMRVSETDALWNDTTITGLANKYKKKISESVLNYKKQTNWVSILKYIGKALLIIIIVFLVVKYILRYSALLLKWIRKEEGKLLNGIKLRNYMLFDARKEINFLLRLTGILKWIAILLTIYVGVLYLLSIFPWTSGFGDTLSEWILTPIQEFARKLWNYLPKLITIIIIVIFFRYILKALRYFKSEIEKGHLNIQGFYSDWANPTYQIIRVLILAFMVVVIFPYLPGSDSPVFKGVSVFLGFLLTFGSAGALSNIISGIVLTYMRQFKIGDRVKIGEVTGDIIEKTLLVTRIRTIKNEVVSIPNSIIMSHNTVNYSSEAPDKGLIIHTTVTIGYSVPWKDIHRALIDAALKTNLVLKDPAPFVLQTSLNDFYVSYQINAYTKEPNKQAIIYSELHQNIQDVCNERGIEIMSPHYQANRDGNFSAIPSGYLPKDYKAPGFNIRIEKDGNDNEGH